GEENRSRVTASANAIAPAESAPFTNADSGARAHGLGAHPAKVLHVDAVGDVAGRRGPRGRILDGVVQIGARRLQGDVARNAVVTLVGILDQSDRLERSGGG